MLSPGAWSNMASTGTFETAAAALRRTDRDIDRLPKLDSLRAIIETYLEIFIAKERPEERAVTVRWGATFPSNSALPLMVEVDRQTDLNESRLGARIERWSTPRQVACRLAPAIAKNAGQP